MTRAECDGVVRLLWWWFVCSEHAYMRSPDQVPQEPFGCASPTCSNHNITQQIIDGRVRISTLHAGVPSVPNNSQAFARGIEKTKMWGLLGVEPSGNAVTRIDPAQWRGGVTEHKRYGCNVRTMDYSVHRSVQSEIEPRFGRFSMGSG